MITQHNAPCCWWTSCVMIGFSPPILEHFCQLFEWIAQMGLICPDGFSFCPECHPQPLFFTQQSHTPFWEMYVLTQNTLKPTQKHPFSWPSNFKVCKMNYSLGNLDPNWAKCLKSGQKFSRSGQKKSFIHVSLPAVSVTVTSMSICFGTSVPHTSVLEHQPSNFKALHWWIGRFPFADPAHALWLRHTSNTSSVQSCHSAGSNYGRGH